jgi:hypothetical protein
VRPRPSALRGRLVVRSRSQGKRNRQQQGASHEGGGEKIRAAEHVCRPVYGSKGDAAWPPFPADGIDGATSGPHRGCMKKRGRDWRPLEVLRPPNRDGRAVIQIAQEPFRRD